MTAITMALMDRALGMPADRSPFLTALVDRALGMPADRSPFLAEQVAIDATNGLVAAEVGLRAFQGRPLLRRLWEIGTGHDAQRIAAIGGDLLAAQKATIALIRVVMKEESRTQYCVSRVLHNLHAVNRDLDALADQRAADREEVVRLRRELHEEARRLAGEIDGVRRQFQREAVLRRLGELIRAGELHPGSGRLLAAALYQAARHRHFAHELAEWRAAEWRGGLAVIKSLLPGRPAPTVEVVYEAVAEIRPEALEAAAYLVSSATGQAAEVLSRLLGQRLEGRRVDTADAVEASQKARANRGHGRDDALDHLVRPYEFAALAAGGLLNIPLGENPWTLKHVP